MKVKDDKVILNLSYDVDDKKRFNEVVRSHTKEDISFRITDTETILLIVDNTSFPLHLKHLNDREKNCLSFLYSVKDLHKLQLDYELKNDKLELSFFTTRLDEEEFDKELFQKMISVTDVDSKVLVGLFLDNRFHG